MQSPSFRFDRSEQCSSDEMKRPHGRQLRIAINPRSDSAHRPRRVAEAKAQTRQDVPPKKRCAWIFVLILILSAVSFLVAMSLLEFASPEGSFNLPAFLSRSRKPEPENPRIDNDLSSVAPTSSAAKPPKVAEKSHRTSSAAKPPKGAEKSHRTSSAAKPPKVAEKSHRHDPELGKDGTPTVAVLPYHDYAVEKEGAKVRCVGSELPRRTKSLLQLWITIAGDFYFAATGPVWQRTEAKKNWQERA